MNNIYRFHNARCDDKEDGCLLFVSHLMLVGSFGLMPVNTVALQTPSQIPSAIC